MLKNGSWFAYFVAIAVMVMVAINGYAVFLHLRVLGDARAATASSTGLEAVESTEKDPLLKLQVARLERENEELREEVSKALALIRQYEWDRTMNSLLEKEQREKTAKDFEHLKALEEREKMERSIAEEIQRRLRADVIDADPFAAPAANEGDVTLDDPFVDPAPEKSAEDEGK